MLPLCWCCRGGPSQKSTYTLPSWGVPERDLQLWQKLLFSTIRAAGVVLQLMPELVPR